jgi:hypothetical protein
MPDDILAQRRLREKGIDDIAAAYEARVSAAPKAARKFAAETWGETWAHAEMGSLLDFAAQLHEAQQGDWRPLASAPKDGTAVIVLLPERFYPRVVEARWRHDLNYPWWDTRTHHLEWEDVLAWMPFPPAPARSNPPSRGESDAR